MSHVLSYCTLISSPSWLHHTGSSNILSPSTMTSPLTPGLWHCAPNLQPLQLPKIFLKLCMFNIMCTSLAGCLMLAENISPIYLIEKGIKIYQSAPWTPMQNGHAKQLGCTLMDKAESMWHQACIPDSWWEFAFAHTTHIYNQTLVACLKWHTPHEMLKGEMPNINHLCEFGCGAFIYLPATARANKMAPKSELMTYISVAPGNEHNFLFMHSTNTVFTTAHTVFDECHFPCCPKNRCKPLKNTLGGVIPKPPTSQPGNTPDDIDCNDNVDHDHGYPHHQVQDDDPKHKEPQAPEEEPKEPNPPRTPSGQTW